MKKITSFVLLNLMPLIAVSQSYIVDPTFNPDNLGGSAIFSIERQNDGKLIVGGTLSSFNGTPINKLMRLNADGTPDDSFNTGAGPAGMDINDTPYINCIVIDSNQKILVGGHFMSFNGQFKNLITRLNPDGSPDNSFIGTYLGQDYDFNTVVKAIAVQQDGKILIAGEFKKVSQGTVFNMIRLNSDGTHDTNFVTPEGYFDEFNSVYDLAVQPDGKILVGGWMLDDMYAIRRLESSGATDIEFESYAFGVVRDIELLSDGKILIGGLFRPSVSTPNTYIIRQLESNGAMDPDFVPTPVASMTTEVNVVNDIAANGNEILIAGKFPSFGIEPHLSLSRLSLTGVPDSNFNIGTSISGFNQLHEAVFDTQDSSYLIGGTFTVFNGTSKSGIARIGDASLGSDIPEHYNFSLSFSDNQVNVRCQENIILANIYDISGRLVCNTFPSAGIFSIDFSRPSGVYIMFATLADNRMIVKKFVN